MKKILLISLFTNICCFVSSQVFDKTSSWTEITTNLFNESYCYVRNYKLDGDTLINELQYTKVYLNNDLYDAALRETEDNKVYAYFYSLEKEKLVYDFSWEIGKTICSEHYYDAEETCTEITQIENIQLLDGNYYNYFPLGNIVQGIGNINGFFITMFELPTNGDQFRLICFSKNGELVYKDNVYKTCNSCEKAETSLKNLDDNKNDIQILNTANGILVDLSLNDDRFYQFYLYDVTGNQIASYQIRNEKQLVINRLIDGYYCYRIVGKDTEYTGKFVIRKK